MTPLQSFIDHCHGVNRPALNPVSSKLVKWAEREEERREISYYGELDELTGQISDLSHYAKQDKARAQTRLVSDKMADRCERLRIGGYHQGELIRIVAPLSKSIEEIPPYRRNNSIPYIAQQKRSNTLKELIYYVEMESKKRGVCFRQWVIHDGPRCHAMHLPERWRAQNRKIREWNKYYAKKFGAYIEFRSNEAGSPLKKAKEKTYDKKTKKWVRKYIRDAKGKKIRALDDKRRQTWHPHTHCLVKMTRFLTESEFQDLILAAQRHFKTPKLDSGAVKEPREICKYVVKCADLSGIRDIDFMRFLKHTFKKQLVRPLGALQDQINKHKEQCKKLRARYDHKKQMCFYQLMNNHNQSAISGKKTAGEEILDVEKHIENLENPDDKKNLEKCAIVARLSPQAQFCPVAEPLFMVRGRVDMNEFCDRDEVQEVVQHTEAAFIQGLAAFEAIHGYSPEQFLTGSRMAAQCGTQRWQPPEPSIFEGSAHNTPVNGKPKTNTGVSESQRASFVGDHTPPVHTREPQLDLYSDPEKTKPADLSIQRASFVGDLQTTLN